MLLILYSIQYVFKFISFFGCPDAGRKRSSISQWSVWMGEWAFWRGKSILPEQSNFPLGQAPHFAVAFYIKDKNIHIRRGGFTTQVTVPGGVGAAVVDALAPSVIDLKTNGFFKTGTFRLNKFKNIIFTIAIGRKGVRDVYLFKTRREYHHPVHDDHFATGAVAGR